MRGMNYFILGLGLSGKAAAKLALKKGTVFLYDDNPERFREEEVKQLLADGCFLVKRKQINRVLGVTNLLIVSPGVERNHYIIECARRLRIETLGELAFGARFCKAPIVAVTGTNGKTTTCMLLQKILSKKRKTFLLGNVGVPFCAQVEQVGAEDLVVLETSSFQLEYSEGFHPKISLLLNLAPDHIAWHGGYENYRNGKYRIFRSQTKDDAAILLSDSSLLPPVGPIVWRFGFSENGDGVFCDEKIVYCKCGRKREKICDVKDLPQFPHERLNALACFAVAEWFKLDRVKTLKVIQTFTPAEHRLEECGKQGELRFINDSKATNVHAAMAALRCFPQENVCIILGGSDKGETFAPLLEELKRRNVFSVFVGETAEKLQCEANRCGYQAYQVCKNLTEATAMGAATLKNEGVLLFSPACASFDAFQNYKERGDFFKKTVKEWLVKNETTTPETTQSLR